MKRKEFLRDQKFIKRMIRESKKEKDDICYNGWIKELQGLKITYMTKEQRKKYLLRFFSIEELNNIWGIYF